MAADRVDRLSQLPDDILRRILHLVPLKEAASTIALSRRWRAPLWLSSGALNLETGVVRKPRRRYNDARFFSGSDDFISAATAALDAADLPVTRLHLIAWYTEYPELVSSYKGLVEILLSHRAARRLEELRLVAVDPYRNYNNPVGLYMVSLHSVQSETLRVLELTYCMGLDYNGEAVFPRLSSLRLSHCHGQHLGSLQRLIDAAPALAVVQLENVIIEITQEEAKESIRCCLRCPATTMLVLDSCTLRIVLCSRGWYSNKIVDPLEIDATRLRRFSYKGPLRSYLFSPRPLELAQVDLWVSDPNSDLGKFWRFTQNFTSTKEMKLRVNHLEDIAVLSEARQVQLLPTFRRLECLECQGAYWTKDKTAPLATILNLLQCCPVLTALRIHLIPKYEEASDKEEVRKRTTRKEILAAAMVGPRYLFQCLQSSLKRVDLQFQLEKRDCFGVKLMKTFAENAMVLEEMRIDSGDEKLCEHMNRRVEKWNSIRTELGATCFVLLPLKS